MVSLKEAAAISGLSVASYKAGIARGHFPGPIMPYRKIHLQTLRDDIDRVCGYTPNKAAQENDTYDFEACLGKGFYSDASSIGRRKNRKKAAGDR